MELNVTLNSSLIADGSTSSSPSYRRNMPSPDIRSSVSIHCRICHEDGNAEELVDPCECSGTVALIHASCLEKWLATSNTDRCEICKYTYVLQRKNKTLSQWCRSKSVLGPQGVAGDVICLVILTPLCIAATYLCGVGASAYTRLGLWEGTGLAVLCCMLIATYCLWLVVTVRFHYKVWRQWRIKNQEVQLLVKHRCDDLPHLKSTKKSSRRKEDRNNNNSNSFANALTMFGVALSHTNDPVMSVEQQTSLV